MSEVAPILILEGARRILEDWPDSAHLRELIETTEKALTEGSDQAIDGAKCIIECVCKTILDEHGGNYDNTTSPSALVKLAARAAGIVENDADASLRDIASGLTTATAALAELRNANGPLGHGRNADHPALDFRHRLLAVRTAEAVALTLFEAQRDLPPSPAHTRRPYDHEDDVNEAIDRACLMEVDVDAAEVVINQSLKYRASHILYAIDREAYVDVLANLEAEEANEGDGEEAMT